MCRLRAYVTSNEIARITRFHIICKSFYHLWALFFSVELRVEIVIFGTFRMDLIENVHFCMTEIAYTWPALFIICIINELFCEFSIILPTAVSIIRRVNNDQCQCGDEVKREHSMKPLEGGNIMPFYLNYCRLRKSNCQSIVLFSIEKAPWITLKKQTNVMQIKRIKCGKSKAIDLRAIIFNHSQTLSFSTVRL